MQTETKFSIGTGVSAAILLGLCGVGPVWMSFGTAMAAYVGGVIGCVVRKRREERNAPSRDAFITNYEQQPDGTYKFTTKNYEDYQDL